MSSNVETLQTAKGLVTNNGGGGHVKFHPSKKGGGRKSFSHAEGGHNKFLSCFYTVA